MNRVLIAGAGAEVDLGFRSGLSFTQDTFYRQKVRLYNALSDFYEQRLDASHGGLIPSSYEPAFLFNSNGAAFKKLVNNLAKDDPSFLTKALGKSLQDVEDDSTYTNEDYKTLFKNMIKETDDSNVVRDQEAILGAIPSDAHFGVLEQYYSEMLNPEGHKRRFWKLVNFYWSAFFSIVLPITDDSYGNKASYNEDRYAYVLTHLDDVVSEMFDQRNVVDRVSTNCYYSLLRGKFNKVLTTNYTPYSASVVNFEDSRISWLAGRLSQFEHLPELEFTDYSTSDKRIGDNDFVFPYLLCQSPVKPVISLAQIREYAKAADALKEADEIVVLGYSFCNEDAHISSMVGEALRSNETRKLVYFRHESENTPPSNRDSELSKLAKKLRISESLAKERIELEPISNCESEGFQKRCSEWN